MFQIFADFKEVGIKVFLAGCRGKAKTYLIKKRLKNKEFSREKFGDTKGVFRNRQWKKDRQSNGQKKKDKL